MCITSVRFCLSYDLLNAILSPSNCVYFNEKLHCCIKSSQNFIEDSLTEGMRIIQHTNKTYIKQVMNN